MACYERDAAVDGALRGDSAIVVPGNDAGRRDAGLIGGDCRLNPSLCTGFTYCGSSGSCLPGCAGDSACDFNESCDLVNHTCRCASGQTRCGSSCVSCPSGSGVANTTCSGEACVISSCTLGYSSCGGTCALCPTGGSIASTTCSGTSCVAASCYSGSRVCGGNCTSCPTGGVASTTCSGVSCVAASCSAGYTLCGSGCCPTTPTWSTSVVEYTAGGYSSIAVDSTSAVHVAYTSDASGRGVFYRVLRSGAWSSRETVDSNTNAMYPALSLSGTTPVVAYEVLQNADPLSFNAYTKTLSGSSWTNLQTHGGFGRPHLSSSGSYEVFGATYIVTGGSSYVYFYSRSSPSTFWSFVGNYDVGGSWPFVQVASTTGPVTVYANNTALYVRSGTATPVLVHSGLMDTYSATTDANGKIHVVYAGNNDHIVRYKRYSSSLSLETTATVDSPGAGSQTISGMDIAVGSSRIVVSYLDHSRGSVLRVAIHDGSWVPATVTSAEEILGQTSVALESGMIPHITFPAPATSFSNLGYAVLR